MYEYEYDIWIWENRGYLSVYLTHETTEYDRQPFFNGYKRLRYGTFEERQMLVGFVCTHWTGHIKLVSSDVLCVAGDHEDWWARLRLLSPPKVRPHLHINREMFPKCLGLLRSQLPIAITFTGREKPLWWLEVELLAVSLVDPLIACCVAGTWVWTRWRRTWWSCGDPACDLLLRLALPFQSCSEFRVELLKADILELIGMALNNFTTGTGYCDIHKLIFKSVEMCASAS